MQIAEEGLADLVAAGLHTGRLSFGTDNATAVQHAEFTFLCVSAPQGPEGGPDLSAVESAARAIGPELPEGAVVVNKSTLPVGSTLQVSTMLCRPDVAVVANPEFLREGHAVEDFLHPARIVIGATDAAVAKRVAVLYEGTKSPVILTDPLSAETIKYAANAFLATKISFANEIATFCELVGADVREVVAALAHDPRIGAGALAPGPGWGGSCLPKDAAAFLWSASEVGYELPLLRSVIATNDEQRSRITNKVMLTAGGTLQDQVVALWGLTFKAGTDDLRASPAIDIAERVIRLGARVKAYDPAVSRPVAGLPDGVELCGDPYDACEDAVVLVVATEWEEFVHLDFSYVGSLMARRAIVDARNLLDAELLLSLGFAYLGVGVPQAGARPCTSAILE